MQKVFRPLLYTTTVRNPERIKYFLHVLERYNGRILTNELIREIECDLFKLGLYRPVKTPQSAREKWKGLGSGELAEIALTDEEAREVYDLNPQRHKESGFDYGWPSRFDTQFKLAKTLGFVWYEANGPISLSATGELLAGSARIDISDGIVKIDFLNPAGEQSAFRMALSKQQRNNPFIRELNDNVPLILLLRTIQKLNSDDALNHSGIAYRELPLLLCWKDDDSEALYRRIKKLRSDIGYKYSDDLIWEICVDEILGGSKKFKLKSLIQEYPDEFVRKMRMTGLISLRGGGRFIDINSLENETIKYILEKYSTYKKYDSEREYYEYLSTLDKNLLKSPDSKQDKSDASQKLAKLANEYSWDTIRTELALLENKGHSRHNVLKYLADPVRLEFLTALAIKSRFPDAIVYPNYPCDDEGIPVSTAPGGGGDIECREDSNGVLVEVTMSRGRTQTMTEIWPIARHLDEFMGRGNMTGAECVFVAPSIFIDSQRQINFLRETEGTRIRAYKITDFARFLETADKLFVG